jgi:hypothetical protein
MINSTQWTEAERSQGIAPGALCCVESSSAITAVLGFMEIEQPPEQLVRKGIEAYITNLTHPLKIESTRE